MSDLEQIQQEFMEQLGRTSQALGHGRSLGQIFGYLYLCQDAQSLDDLTQHLGISKGGASMAVRQLEQWGAVKRVWIKGDRKDYYLACDDFGTMVRKAAFDTVGSRMRELDEVMGDLDKRIKAVKSSSVEEKKTQKFIQKRLKTLFVFRDRAKWIWDRSIVKLLVGR